MSAGKELSALLSDAAAHENRKVANALDGLRNRLGRDGLSMDEWNGLVSAAFYLRIDAAQREPTSSAATDDPAASDPA